MSTPTPSSADPRTAPHPLVQAAVRGLARANARHPWDHNAHFHRWMLAGVPAGAQRVLDVGCGRGDLVRALRTVAPQVEGVDPDPAMAYAAAEATRGMPGVRIARRDLAEHAAETAHQGTYDAVCMSASLHHMDLATALSRARSLLRPGGRLLVATLVRPTGTADRLWDLGCALSNPLIGLVVHPRPVTDPARLLGPGTERREDGMPVRQPAFSTAELRETAAELLPGARVRRRVGFRVTLRWTAPPDGD